MIELADLGEGGSTHGRLYTMHTLNGMSFHECCTSSCFAEFMCFFPSRAQCCLYILIVKGTSATHFLHSIYLEDYLSFWF